MDIQQFVDEGLGHFSYLVDVGNGLGAIIDPPRFAAQHIERARSVGLTPAWTIDTHSHADYVTGSPALVVSDEMTFLAPAASQLETSHVGISDGERLRLATGVDLVAIATPGHTPDHHVYLLERDGKADALFTGGSLMVGAVGRTDLCGPDLAEPLAHAMFHSLRKLDGLPDDLEVFPTHGAGSFCSAPGGAARTTTLGRERTSNALFQITDEDAFVEQLLAGLGSFPTYFALLPERNRRGPRYYPDIPPLDRLGIADFDAAAAGGAAVVDVRPIEAFARGHIPGSISNTLRSVFASWLGWIVELDQPVLIVADEHQSRSELMRQCLDIGHERIVGELLGSIEAWRAAGRAIDGTSLVAPEAVVGTIIDVRQHREFVAGHVPGAVNLELGALATSEVPDGPITLMCGHGERAMTAASLLMSAGHRDVNVLAGGPDTWAEWSGRPLAVGR